MRSIIIVKISLLVVAICVMLPIYFMVNVAPAQAQPPDVSGLLRCNRYAYYPYYPYGCSRVDSVDTFNWPNNLSTWTGYLTAPVSGMYNFQILHDHDARFSINGNYIINNQSYAYPYLVVDTGSLSLTANVLYPLRLDHGYLGGQNQIRLSWQIPGESSYSVITSSYLVLDPFESFWLSGDETIGLINKNYNFTATFGITPPVSSITYNWLATDQPPFSETLTAIKDTHSFSWNSDGVKVVTVTATSGAQSAMSVYTMTVSSNCFAQTNQVIYTTVQAGIDAANEGDTVKVAGACKGVELVNGTSQTAYIDKSITLQGGYTTTNWTTPNWASNPTTLDALGLGRVISITGDITPTIEGLIITGGKPSNDGIGGGIWVNNAHPTFNYLVVSNNFSTGHSGGGLGVSQASRIKIFNTIIEDNISQNSGGGVGFFDSNQIVISNTIIQNNRGINLGGGISIANANDVLIKNSRVISNKVTNSNSDGGGIYISNSNNYTIVNSVIANNRSMVNGLNLELVGGANGRMYQTTIIYTGNDSNASLHVDITDFELVNSIIVSPKALHTLNPMIATASFITGKTTSNGGAAMITLVQPLTNCTPSFVDLSGGNYRQATGSCGIDTGLDLRSLGIVEDIDGVVRPQDNGYDIGAYEDNPPTARFTAMPATVPVAAPAVFYFTNLSSNSISSTWNFGDNSPILTSTNPSHTYAKSGTYMAVLTATNLRGQSDVTTTTITIYQAPQANFSLPSRPQVNKPVLFTDTSIGDYSRRTWDFGDGTPILDYGNQFVSHVYSLTKTYNITLTISGSGGTHAIVKPLRVYTPAVASFELSPMPYVVGSNVAITDTSTGDYTSTNRSCGNASNSRTISLPSCFYQDAGVYTIILTANGYLNISTARQVITVHPKVAADFQVSSLQGPAPSTIVFTNTSQGYTSSLWDFGDGITSTLNNITHTYTQIGDYTVKLTVNGPGGIAIKIIKITVYAPCQPKLFINPTTGFAPLDVTLTNQSNSTCQFDSWDFGDGLPLDKTSPNQIAHIYTKIGQLTATLTVHDPVGQIYQAKARVEVVDARCQVSSVTLTPQGTANLKQPLELTYTIDPQANQCQNFTLEQRWYRQSNQTEAQLQPGLNNTVVISGDLTAEGENWWATVTPCRFGACATTVQSNKVAIVKKPNQLAHAIAMITPPLPLDGDYLQVKYNYSDEDGQLEKSEKTQIRWERDGKLEPKFNNQQIVTATETFPGEKWCVFVQPHDDIELGVISVPYCIIIGLLNNHPPQALTPTLQTINTITNSWLQVNYQYQDLDDGANSEVGTEIRWYRNGILQPGFNNRLTVPLTQTIPGEMWTVVIRPLGGGQYGLPVESQPVPIHDVNNNTPPIAGEALISPANPTDEHDLHLTYHFTDTDHDAEGNTLIYWFNNPYTRSVQFDGLTTIPAEYTHPNENWFARITPHDGISYGLRIDSHSVKITPIINSEPRVEEVLLTPSQPGDDNALELKYTFIDRDGPYTQSSTQIRWFKNNKYKRDFDDVTKIPPSATDEGDVWYAKVTPYDLYENQGKIITTSGETITSNQVTVLQTPINKPPYILGDVQIAPSPIARSNEALVLRYIFKDDDGDPEKDSEIRWYKDGVIQIKYDGQTAVHAEDTEPGQGWHATVRVHDGKLYSEKTYASSLVTINYPPQIKRLDIIPSNPIVGQSLALTYTLVDTNSEGVSSQLLTRWYIDNQRQIAYDNHLTLPAQAIQTGQVVSVEGIPFDDYERGLMVSTTVKIAKLEITWAYIPLIFKDMKPTPTPTGTLPPTATFTPTPTFTPIPTATPIPCSPESQYERNDEFATACPISLAIPLETYPDDDDDVFYFVLEETSYVRVEVNNYQVNTRPNQLVVHDAQGNLVAFEQNLSLTTNRLPNHLIPNPGLYRYSTYYLSQGKYYVTIYTKEPKDQYPAYQLLVNATPLRLLQISPQ